MDRSSSGLSDLLYRACIVTLWLSPIAIASLFCSCSKAASVGFHQQSIFFRKAGVQICSGPLLQAIAQFEAAEKRQVLGATTTVTTST